MRVSAILATFPARRAALPHTVMSLRSQVDEVIVVANEFARGDLDTVLPAGVRVIHPSRDLKDEGKFCRRFDPDQYVLLCDDDILYPADYVSTLMDAYRAAAALEPIVGVHGVVYSDFFDGKAESRIVHVFTARLARSEFVNQLGTGTVLCRGYQMPNPRFMEGSAKFVDLRFAVHCHRHGFPRLCVAREAGWMKDQNSGTSLFTSFTRHWPDHVTREAQEIAGLRFLPSTPASDSAEPPRGRRGR